MGFGWNAADGLSPQINLLFTFLVVMTIHMLTLGINLLLLDHFRQNLFFCCKAIGLKALCLRGEKWILVQNAQTGPNGPQKVQFVYCQLGGDLETMAYAYII